MTALTDLQHEFAEATREASVSDLRPRADAFWRRHGQEPDLVLEVLTGLWTRSSTPELGRVRMGVTIALGQVAAQRPTAMRFLVEESARDADWRVQEALAMAFEAVCSGLGWQTSVSVIERWMESEEANVRRAASEGPRVWIKRPYFDAHPEHELELLGRLRSDRSLSVRQSVANAVGDIGKAHPDLVVSTLLSWQRASQDATWVIKNACKKLEKASPA